MSRTLASIRILNLAYELQRKTAAAVHEEARRILAHERNLHEVTFTKNPVDDAPVVRGHRCSRLSLRESTLRLHDDDTDTVFTEHSLTGPELLGLLKDLEDITALIDRGDVTISNGVLMRA